ncbi:MAG: hypothetical protein M3Y86_03205, partial [Verrucomicrobiota bacterium]|nr:hypothetical protein [Verrucomicrobiota bacterium]
AKNVLAGTKRNIVIILIVGSEQSLPLTEAKKMITKIATCLLVVSAFAACSTAPTATNTTAARRSTMESRLLAQNNGNPNAVVEPAPPAEGPEDVPATGTVDPTRNPGLLPTPLLRGNAAGGL